jgi:hypothetical protein
LKLHILKVEIIEKEIIISAPIFKIVGKKIKLGEEIRSQLRVGPDTKDTVDKKITGLTKM